MIKTNKGFTLIEVLLSITLIAICLSFCTFISMKEISKNQLKGTSMEIKNFIHLAQEISSKQQKYFRLSVNKSNNQITLRERKFNGKLLDTIKIPSNIVFISASSDYDINTNGNSKYFVINIKNQYDDKASITVLPVTNEVKISVSK